MVRGEALSSPTEAAAAVELAERRQRYLLLGPWRTLMLCLLVALWGGYFLVHLLSGSLDRLSIQVGIVGLGAMLLLLNNARLRRRARRAMEANSRRVGSGNAA